MSQYRCGIYLKFAVGDIVYLYETDGEGKAKLNPIPRKVEGIEVFITDRYSNEVFYKLSGEKRKIREIEMANEKDGLSNLKAQIEQRLKELGEEELLNGE